MSPIRFAVAKRSFFALEMEPARERGFHPENKKTQRRTTPPKHPSPLIKNDLLPRLLGPCEFSTVTMGRDCCDPRLLSRSTPEELRGDSEAFDLEERGGAGLTTGGGMIGAADEGTSKSPLIVDAGRQSLIPSFQTWSSGESFPSRESCFSLAEEIGPAFSPLTV